MDVLPLALMLKVHLFSSDKGDALITQTQSWFTGGEKSEADKKDFYQLHQSVAEFLQNTTRIITFCISTYTFIIRTNMFMIHQEPNEAACIALADRGVWRH